jgi:hypothetical protein
MNHISPNPIIVPVVCPSDVPSVNPSDVPHIIEMAAMEIPHMENILVENLNPCHDPHYLTCNETKEICQQHPIAQFDMTKL